jgi:hypothetical protein
MVSSKGMRHTVVRGLVLIVALAAVGSAGASMPPDRAHFQARATLDRALSIFRGEGTDPRGATMALRDLRLRLGRLTPSERAVARSLLARPTDGGKFDWSAPKGSRRHLCTTHFCIHWVKKTKDAPSHTDKNHNHKPDYVDSVKSVMKTVWKKEIGLLHYHAPLADGNSGSHHGGNPNKKVDIYLQDVGDQGLYGYCTTDDPRFSHQSNVSAYCVFDDDFSASQFSGVHGIDALKVTAAHEFNHAIQFSYDVREDTWFLEATATNMEATVYPSIHDNYQYFPSSPLSNTMPWRAIDQFQTTGTNQYGSWIFFRFLCEWMTAPSPGNHPISTQPDCSIVRKIWQAAAVHPGTKNGGTYSTKAIKDVLSANGQHFVDLLRRFGAANADPAVFYKDGGLFGAKAGTNAILYPIKQLRPGHTHFGTYMFHMSNDYERVKPKAGDSSIAIGIDFPASPFTPRATVLVYNQAGALSATDEIALNASGNSPSPYTHSFSTATVSKIVLIITNAGTRFQCNKRTLLSCKGKPLDDSAKVSNPHADDDYIVDFNVS